MTLGFLFGALYIYVLAGIIPACLLLQNQDYSGHRLIASIIFYPFVVLTGVIWVLMWPFKNHHWTEHIIPIAKESGKVIVGKK